MTAARHLRRGIGLILVATLGIVLMNACAKMSSLACGPVSMVFYRGVVALTLLVPYMLLTRPLSVFRPRRIGVHLVRAMIGNLGVAFVFWAYALLPMADATALLFASPLFVTALSPLLLGERVDGSRWGAVVTGFAGIVLITRPSPALVSHPAALIGLAAALCVALVDITLRKLGRTDEPLTTVFYFLLIGVILSAPLTLVTGDPPPGHLIPWLLGIGIFAGLQQLAKTTAYRLAEASLLAPYTYTAIIWAALAGWLLWDDIPSAPVVAGTLVVISSNLFIAWREAQRSSAEGGVQ
ncbi:MAG: DMT family transporter [Desulfobacterales bacterium]|nr:DMT family transporter [Desulfobacterales bacterium]